MNEFIKDVIDATIKVTLDFREAAGAYLGPRLYIFQLMSLVISGVLIWGIIYTVSKSGWLNKRIENWMDFLGVGDVGKRRQLRAWNQIVKRIKTNDMSNWKVAILEADKILDDIIKASGFRADTHDERIKQVMPEVLSNIEQIREAHRVRNRIAQEPDFTITREEAIATLKIYKAAFQEYGLLD